MVGPVSSSARRRGPHPGEGGGLGLPSSALLCCWSRAPIARRLCKDYKVELPMGRAVDEGPHEGGYTSRDLVILPHMSPPTRADLK